MSSVIYVPAPKKAFYYFVGQLKKLPWTPVFSHLSFKSDEQEPGRKTISLKGKDTIELGSFEQINDLNVVIHGKHNNRYLLVEKTLPHMMQKRGYALSKGYIHYQGSASSLELSFGEKDNYSTKEGIYMLLTKRAEDDKDPDSDQNKMVDKSREIFKSWFTRITDSLPSNALLNPYLGYVSVHERLRAEKKIKRSNITAV